METKINKWLFFYLTMTFMFSPLIVSAGNSAAAEKDVPKSAKDGLFYMWLFDEGVAGHQFSTIYDTENYWMQEYKTNFFQDTFKGNFEYVEGVSGTCGKFDGFTTHIVRTYIKVPDLTDGFAIQGWIAPQATKKAAIMCQEKNSKKGFIFGLFDGKLGIQMAVDGRWLQCLSDKKIPLRKWSHVAVTFSSKQGIRLYLNAKQVGSCTAKGKMTDVRMENLLIGMSKPKELKLRESGGKFPPIDKKLYYHMAYDGLIDELKLYEESLSPDDIEDLYYQCQPKSAPHLNPRLLPVAPKVQNPHFGAVYCKLNYYDEYEQIQRIGDWPDLLIRFDNSPVRLMFVHTNNYIPIWITENNKLISDQSMEINGENGFYEVMMDKQNRYSNVRLLENNDARIVVHWRYALCDRFYQIARPDKRTDWGDWADEYFTVYPDGVAVRKWVYYTSTYGEDYLQFQETILQPQTGNTCDDDVQKEALTLANMKGQTHTYSWAEGVPPYFPKPLKANIQMVNMKSEYRPFIIFEPGSQIDKYIWGYRKGQGSKVSRCLASAMPVVHKGKKRNSYEAAAIYGMTSDEITDVLPLAKSWTNPPPLLLESAEYTNKGFDKYQRAYLLELKQSGKPALLSLRFSAEKQSPLVKPALVIKNWGRKSFELKINRKKTKPKRDYRYGYRETLNGCDLIIWMNLDSTGVEKIQITPFDG